MRPVKNGNEAKRKETRLFICHYYYKLHHCYSPKNRMKRMLRTMIQRTCSRKVIVPSKPKIRSRVSGGTAPAAASNSASLLPSRGAAPSPPGGCSCCASFACCGGAGSCGASSSCSNPSASIKNDMNKF